MSVALINGRHIAHAVRAVVVFNNVDLAADNITGFRIVAVAVVLVQLAAKQRALLVGVAAFVMGVTARTHFQTASRVFADRIAGVAMLVRALPDCQRAVGDGFHAVAFIGVDVAAQIRGGCRFLRTHEDVDSLSAGRPVNMALRLFQTASRSIVLQHTVAGIRMHMASGFSLRAHQRRQLLVAGVVVLVLGVVHQRADQAPRLIIAFRRMAVPVRG